MGQTVCCPAQKPLTDNTEGDTKDIVVKKLSGNCSVIQDGDPLTLNMRCSDGRMASIKAGTLWKVLRLQKALEEKVKVYPSAQKLLFAGRRLQSQDVLGELGLMNNATVYVFVMTTFPAKLGPFATFSIPFQAEDLQSPPWSDDVESSGSMWTMEKRALKRHGITATGIEMPLMGQYSPANKITLTDEEKEAANIPVEAADFMWSYPACSWDGLGGDDAMKAYLSLGGFAYFDKEHKLVGTNTLMPMEGDEGGLQFSEPKHWNPEWTRALMRHGRFQVITIKTLRDVGARHYCWLRPGEVICGDDGKPLSSQPEVAHGGFAYLFHDNALSTDAEEIEEDRCFAILSGEEYVKPVEMDNNNKEFRTFSLAADVMQMHELTEKLAKAPDAEKSKISEELGELQGKVACSIPRSSIDRQNTLALRGWALDEVPSEGTAWNALAEMLKPSDPKDLGIGRDVRAKVTKKTRYTSLQLEQAWRVSAPIRESRYNTEKLQVKSHARMLPDRQLPQTEARLTHVAQALDVDLQVNETFLWHGTLPENVLAILQNGLNERFSEGTFGQGIYACEDSAKMDQYCMPDDGKDTKLKNLRTCLSGETDLPAPVFYAFACRTILGVPTHTKDGEKDMNSGGAIYSGSSQRELAYIPGTDPPVHFHTLIVEAGTGCKLLRHREVVAFHAERIVPEYLVAFSRK